MQLINDILHISKPSHPPTTLLKGSKIEMYVILWPAEYESLTLHKRNSVLTLPSQ